MLWMVAGLRVLDSGLGCCPSWVECGRCDIRRATHGERAALGRRTAACNGMVNGATCIEMVVQRSK